MSERYRTCSYDDMQGGFIKTLVSKTFFWALNISMTWVKKSHNTRTLILIIEWFASSDNWKKYWSRMLAWVQSDGPRKLIEFAIVNVQPLGISVTSSRSSRSMLRRSDRRFPPNYWINFSPNALWCSPIVLWVGCSVAVHGGTNITERLGAPLEHHWSSAPSDLELTGLWHASAILLGIWGCNYALTS